MLNFCDFILVYVFTTNHHLKRKQVDCVGCVSKLSVVTDHKISVLDR